MAFEIIMPKAGIDMTEGEIIKWLKKEGDKVEEGEIILEIMTDKTTMEIEAEYSGYLLKIVRQEGETVAITEVLAYIGEKGEDIVPEEEEEIVVPADDDDSSSLIRLEDTYHVAVIGGGPAGYVAAIRAAQLGAKVAIIEKKSYGGTCLNRGCIPTKAYMKNAEIIEAIKNSASRGIVLENDAFSIDMPKVVKYKNGVVKQLTGGVAALLKSNNVDMFKGVAKINKNKNVVVNDTQIIKADKIIFAGGSKVSKFNIPGMDNPKVMTSDDILDYEKVPKSLVVIGGGVVGIELGQAFHALGSKVTVVEMMDRIVPGIDKEASEFLRSTLEKENMEIITSAQITEIVDTSSGLDLRLNDGRSIKAEKALLSVGRVPDTEGMGEIEFEMERGKIKVDKYMETSVKGIYAPGDINGIKMLAHVAFRMGEVAADNAVLGNKRSVRIESSPSAIYTTPEVAMVGLTEEQAQSKYDIRVGKFNFAANGRALASGENKGFVKVIADQKYGEILGVHIVGPAAAEIINQAASLMELEITVDEVVKTIYGHPTYSEALFEACADVLGEAVHIPKKK